MAQAFGDVHALTIGLTEIFQPILHLLILSVQQHKKPRRTPSPAQRLFVQIRLRMAPMAACCSVDLGLDPSLQLQSDGA
jgi:hypothetical protein